MRLAPVTWHRGLPPSTLPPETSPELLRVFWQGKEEIIRNPKRWTPKRKPWSGNMLFAQAELQVRFLWFPNITHYLTSTFLDPVCIVVLIAAMPLPLARSSQTCSRPNRNIISIEVAIFYHYDLEMALDAAARSSLTTHPGARGQ